MHLLALVILAAGPVCETIPVPTRDEVYAYDLSDSDAGCGSLFDSDGKKCDSISTRK